MAQRVAIAGWSGLIGRALTSALRARGAQVLPVVRSGGTSPSGAERTISFDPVRAEMDSTQLDDVDVVVNLAGEPVAQRWTQSTRDAITASRVGSTTALTNAISDSLSRRPRPVRLLNASAIGYYGDRGDEKLTETSGPGDGFLAGVVTEWERASAPAADAGAATALLRTGIVLSDSGGALAPMLRLAKLGLLGPMGSGRQWWSWISLTDHVRAMSFLIEHEDIVGPVNLVGPHPDHQRDVASAVAASVGRRAIVPAPGFALRLAVGGFAGELLGSARVLPAVLTDAGFEFTHDSVGAALAPAGTTTAN